MLEATFFTQLPAYEVSRMRITSRPAVMQLLQSMYITHQAPTESMLRGTKYLEMYEQNLPPVNLADQQDDLQGGIRVQRLLLVSRREDCESRDYDLVKEEFGILLAEHVENRPTIRTLVGVLITELLSQPVFYVAVFPRSIIILACVGR